MLVVGQIHCWSQILTFSFQVWSTIGVFMAMVNFMAKFLINFVAFLISHVKEEVISMKFFSLKWPSSRLFFIFVKKILFIFIGFIFNSFFLSQLKLEYFILELAKRPYFSSICWILLMTLI